MTPQIFMPAGPLTGTILIPGDKSISHRALMLASLAVGESTVDGMLEGEDVMATAAAMRAMGARIERDEDGLWHIHGVGVGGLLEPRAALDMGNSGTSTRLLMGLIAGAGIRASMIGDASLSRRPMARVIDPLRAMGARVEASEGDTLPLTLHGAHPPVPISYRLPVASAQVKSAVLLAGLNTPGITRVIEPVPTRDHTERMLKAFGAEITIEEKSGERIISLAGPAEFRAQHIEVPADPSSAAFFLVAASVVPGSDVTLKNIGLNPTRAGIIAVLRQMGADIEAVNPREIGGEPVADLRVRHAPLKGIAVDPAIAPSMIDEFPVLFVAAALAEGTTSTSGLAELRVKESDRLSAMATALLSLGVKLEEHADGLTIHGSGGEMLRGSGETPVATQLDHRIAMSMAIAALASRDGVKIDDIAPIATSFPGFIALLEEACR